MTTITSPPQPPPVGRRLRALGTALTFSFEADDASDYALDGELERALDWIRAVEDSCSRFDPDSEVARLAGRPHEWVKVSPLLAGALDTALRLAAITDGAFDPAIGGTLALRDPFSHHLTGRKWHVPTAAGASFRDLELDPERLRVRLRRPVLLDLGAVAKGLAVDLAAQALKRHAPCVIEAGGDIYLAGQRPEAPWRVGIAGGPDALLGTYACAGNQAVCTSGPWFHPTEDGGHHLLDARIQSPAMRARSATAIAPAAMVADAAATATFILGPSDGVALLRELGLEGLIQAGDGRLALTSSWLESAVGATPEHNSSRQGA